MTQEEVESYRVDKTGWGDGLWMNEPDRVDFRHAGLPCLITRHDHHGHLCGYAAVPPGHPLHGKSYQDVDVEVHGGLTYADACQDLICHVPEPGEPDNVWWFGFDCAHARDLSPGMRALEEATLPERLRPSAHEAKYPQAFREVYRDLAYVRHMTERLAEQLAAITA